MLLRLAAVVKFALLIMIYTSDCTIRMYQLHTFKCLFLFYFHQLFQLIVTASKYYFQGNQLYVAINPENFNIATMLINTAVTELLLLGSFV